MGFDVAKDKDDKGITPEDIKVSEDKKTITITEAGVKKEIDVSKLKGKIIIKIPFGGRFRDKHSSLIEDIEFDIDNDNAPKKIKDDDKKTFNVYYFSKEQQEVIVIDGAIQLKKVKLEKGKPLTLGDVFKSEKYYFDKEDGAVFVPVGKEVISIGSSRDDLEPDKNPNTPPQTEKKEDLPIIIEIGKIEDRIQQELLT